jgi:hypothetical protein
MSIWAGVKSIFSSSPNKVLDMASGVGGFIDETFYTDQEKSEANFKLLDFKLKWLNATQGQNLARRYCAIAFGLNFILTFQICLAVVLYGFFTGIDTKIVIDNILSLVGTFQLGYIMITIIAFYFGKEFLKK